MANERAEYVKMLQSVLSGSVPFSVLKDNIPAEERGFANMLLMTTFRQLAFIRETVLPRYIKKKIPHKQQAAEYALYLGAAELLFMETPAYAVVNSYTEAVKSFAAHSAAVLLMPCYAILSAIKTSYGPCRTGIISAGIF